MKDKTSLAAILGAMFYNGSGSVMRRPYSRASTGRVNKSVEERAELLKKRIMKRYKIRGDYCTCLMRNPCLDQSLVRSWLGFDK